jgi:hypothetical protein
MRHWANSTREVILTCRRVRDDHSGIELRVVQLGACTWRSPGACDRFGILAVDRGNPLTGNAGALFWWAMPLWSWQTCQHT